MYMDRNLDRKNEVWLIFNQIIKTIEHFLSVTKEYQ